LAWFTQQEYWKLLAASEDGRFLPQTYPDWCRNAEARFQYLAAQGRAPVKVNVQVAELVGYCRSLGRRIDHSAVEAFAAGTLRDECDMDGRGPGRQQGTGAGRSSPSLSAPAG
jgi:hypothetical protein